MRNKGLAREELDFRP